MTVLIEILQAVLAMTLSILGLGYEREDTEAAVRFQPAEAQIEWQTEAAVFQNIALETADIELGASAIERIAQANTHALTGCDRKSADAAVTITTLSTI